MQKDVVWDVNRAAPLLWKARLKLIFDFQRDGYALAFGQSATTPLLKVMFVLFLISLVLLLLLDVLTYGQLIYNNGADTIPASPETTTI